MCYTTNSTDTCQTRLSYETNLLKSPLGITVLNTEYSIGQPINAIVNYTGYVNSGIYPDVKILNADNGSKCGTIVLILTILIQNWQVVEDLNIYLQCTMFYSISNHK